MDTGDCCWPLPGSYCTAIQLKWFRGIDSGGTGHLATHPICHRGQCLGGATCYYLGRLGKTEWLQKWFRIKPEQIDKMIRWLHGKGVMGFFGFLPAVGDAILVALGFMRANVPLVMGTMTLGKFLRYLLIAFGTEGILSIF